MHARAHARGVGQLQQLPALQANVVQPQRCQPPRIFARPDSNGGPLPHVAPLELPLQPRRLKTRNRAAGAAAAQACACHALYRAAACHCIGIADGMPSGMYRAVDRLFIILDKTFQTVVWPMFNTCLFMSLRFLCACLYAYLYACLYTCLCTCFYTCPRHLKTRNRAVPSLRLWGCLVAVVIFLSATAVLLPVNNMWDRHQHYFW